MSSGRSTATRGEVFSPWPTAGQTPTSLSSSSLTGSIYRLLISTEGLASGFLCVAHLTVAIYVFILHRSCKHLDGKHTIFGKLVGENFCYVFLLELIAPCFKNYFFVSCSLFLAFRYLLSRTFCVFPILVRIYTACYLLLASCILLFVNFFLVLNVRRCLCAYIPIPNT